MFKEPDVAVCTALWSNGVKQKSPSTEFLCETVKHPHRWLPSISAEWLETLVYYVHADDKPVWAARPVSSKLVCRFWSQTLDFPTFRLYSAFSLQASPIFLRASSPSCISRCCSWRLSLRRRWLSCFESSDSGVTPCTWRWSCMSYGCCWSPPVKALSYVSIAFIL